MTDRKKSYNIFKFSLNLFNSITGDGYSGMHLLPEPLFSVPADGSYILTITGSADGRVFMGAKDGCLYELVYQVNVVNTWEHHFCFEERK